MTASCPHCGQLMPEQQRRLEDALADLRKSAALLYSNAVGCAHNHYGDDFSIHGEPGWLRDCRASIERADLFLRTARDVVDQREAGGG